MATIAEFSIPADDFPLGHIFESLPDVTIEIERVVPTEDAILPYFWVRNVSVERVRETLEARGALQSFAVVDDLGTQGLFRANWDANVEGVLTGIVDAELTLLSATGTQEEWIFEFRAEDTDRIAAFQQYCTTHDIDIELSRLHAVGGRNGTNQYSLTPEQREALLLAYNEGYYETPPQTNLAELAEKLGIARQSFTDRLRRGYKNLLGDTLAH
ncbi:helix-turn-helix domain-containing protein [Halorussus amylolyticus]|uniref:helix-turn-helix domain-containing protein n=1 Tax=Halorussus amylolyticus TaxID=1126242 RepID=UPI0010473421|nr:helix-turn-helix domain-containing protein [Halorussus amylolyticus]